MRFVPYCRVFLTAGALLSAASLRAQAMQEWSAIEVAPVAAKHPGQPVAPPTVAVSGPAADLLPNATQPAPTTRLKSDAAPLSGVLATLTKLRPVRFTFLPGQGETGPQYGLLPADLARVYPELVRTNLMTGTQTINTAQLTPILVEAIKELQGQLVVLQGQQLQLAEAYARLVEASSARPAASVVPAFLRRSGKGAEKSPLVAAPASPLPTAPESDATNLE